MDAQERARSGTRLLLAAVIFVGFLQGVEAWPFHLFEKPNDESDGVRLGRAEEGFTPWLMHIIEDMVQPHRPDASSGVQPPKASSSAQSGGAPAATDGEPRAEEWDGVMRHIMHLTLQDFDEHVNGHKQVTRAASSNPTKRSEPLIGR